MSTLSPEALTAATQQIFHDPHVAQAWADWQRYHDSHGVWNPGHGVGGPQAAFYNAVRATGLMPDGFQVGYGNDGQPVLEHKGLPGWAYPLIGAGIAATAGAATGAFGGAFGGAAAAGGGGASAAGGGAGAAGTAGAGGAAAAAAPSMWPLVAGQVGAAALSSLFAPDPFQRRTGFSGDADPNAWMGDVHNLLGSTMHDWQSHMAEPPPEIPFANLEMHGNPGATSPRRVAGTAPPALPGPTSPARAPLSLGPTAPPPAAAAPPTDDPLLQTPPGRNPQSQGAAALLLHTLMDRSRHVPQQGAH